MLIFRHLPSRFSQNTHALCQLFTAEYQICSLFCYHFLFLLLVLSSEVDNQISVSCWELLFFHSGDRDRGLVFHFTSLSSIKNSFGMCFFNSFVLNTWFSDTYNQSPDSHSNPITLRFCPGSFGIIKLTAYTLSFLFNLPSLRLKFFPCHLSLGVLPTTNRLPFLLS